VPVSKHQKNRFGLLKGVIEIKGYVYPFNGLRLWYNDLDVKIILLNKEVS
jgi:hypothetical protein